MVLLTPALFDCAPASKQARRVRTSHEAQRFAARPSLSVAPTIALPARVGRSAA